MILIKSYKLLTNVRNAKVKSGWKCQWNILRLSNGKQKTTTVGSGWFGNAGI